MLYHEGYVVVAKPFFSAVWMYSVKRSGFYCKPNLDRAMVKKKNILNPS